MPATIAELGLDGERRARQEASFSPERRDTKEWPSLFFPFLRGVYINSELSLHGPNVPEGERQLPSRSCEIKVVQDLSKPAHQLSKGKAAAVASYREVKRDKATVLFSTNRIHI
jgi:hypothetical protein